MRVVLAFIAVTLLSAVDAFAGTTAAAISVPTLGEWGMIAMFAILGIVGFIALRKRLSSQSR